MASILSPIRLESATQASDRTSLDVLKSKADGADASKEEQVWAVAEGFEAIFLNIVMKAMRGTDPETNTFMGESFSSRTYKDMYHSELANTMSQRRDGFGVAKMIHDYMTGELTPDRPAALLPASRTVATMDARNYPSGTLPAGELPVNGRISSDFGLRRHPISGEMKFHEGIDIAAPTGTPVRAVADGTVVFSGKAGGYGNMVVVRHAGGVETAYAHNSRNLVRAGQRVASGQTISLVGSTGSSTGPHVHFEVREDGEKINPHIYLKARAMEVKK